MLSIKIGEGERGGDKIKEVLLLKFGSPLGKLIASLYSMNPCPGYVCLAVISSKKSNDNNAQIHIFPMCLRVMEFRISSFSALMVSLDTPKFENKVHLIRVT